MNRLQGAILGIAMSMGAGGLLSPLVQATSLPYASNLVVHGPSGLLSPGTSVTITAQAQGHGSPPLYQFWVESTSGWALAQNYSSSGSLNLGALSAGSDIVVVYALDASQAADHQWAQAVHQTLVLNVGSQVTLHTPTSLLSGDGVTVTAQAQNLIQPVYQWWWQNPQGVWKSSGPYQNNPQLLFTPHQSGTYHVIVYAKDPLAPNNATGAVWSSVASVNVTPVSVAYGYFHLSGTTPGRAWYDLQQHTSAFNAIAPLWYTVTPENTAPVTTEMVPSTMQTVTAYATQHHVQTWPTVTFTGTVDNSWWSSAEPSMLITDLATLAAQDGYGGYTLDWENLPADQGSAFAAFVTQLADALHKDHLTLVVDVLPLPNPAYDYPTLAASANYLNLLAYPEYTPSTPTSTAPNPGPTQGMPWVSQAVADAVQSGVSPAQLLLGVAAYGQSWTYTNKGFQTGSAITSRTIATSLASQNGQSVWDPAQDALEISTGTLAIAPTAPLSYNPSTFNPAVQNLQFLLNAILLRYAVSQGETPPALLATDGGYGPETQAAVAQFQQDFSVQPQVPGVYGPHTAAVLQAQINAMNVGNTESWDETSQATQDLLNLALAQHLGGMTLWRLGYQSPGFWTRFADIWPRL